MNVGGLYSRREHAEDYVCEAKGEYEPVDD